MKDELEQKIAEFYLKEYGSMNHFEYVRNELIEATSEFKKKHQRIIITKKHIHL